MPTLPILCVCEKLKLNVLLKSLSLAVKYHRRHLNTDTDVSNISHNSVFLGRSHHLMIFNLPQNTQLVHNLHFVQSNSAHISLDFSHNVDDLLNRITNCDKFMNLSHFVILFKRSSTNFPLQLHTVTWFLTQQEMISFHCMNKIYVFFSIFLNLLIMKVSINQAGL